MQSTLELTIISADPIICHCLQVRESQIRDAIQSGQVETIRDLRFCTGAGDACMACHRKLRAMIAELS